MNIARDNFWVNGYVHVFFCCEFQVLPSPTTGSYAAGQGFNWKSSYGESQHHVKEEDKSFSSFSFQTQTQIPLASSTGFQSSTGIVQTVCDQFQCTNSFYM